ncbi:MAG: hypothetical protein RLY86_3284 [Pseudomonadota bacterium]|jgi:hypothetical protein
MIGARPQDRAAKLLADAMEAGRTAAEAIDMGAVIERHGAAFRAHVEAVDAAGRYPVGVDLDGHLRAFIADARAALGAMVAPVAQAETGLIRLRAGTVSPSARRAIGDTLDRCRRLREALAGEIDGRLQAETETARAAFTAAVAQGDALADAILLAID